MLPLSYAITSRKLLNSRHIHAVDKRSIICQQRGEGPPHHLTPIDDTDRMPKQPIPIRQDGIVDMQILENLDHGQWRAWQNALLQLLTVLVVEEADVLVQIEDVLVRKAFDVFGDRDDLLQVLVLAVAVDWIVDYYAVDVVVGVGLDQCLFDAVFGYGQEGVVEAAAN